MGKLEGKVALVTGSGRNIGRATVLKLAAEGAHVVVNSRTNQAEAEAVAKEAQARGVKAIAVVADVARKDQVDAMVARAMSDFGRIDILINNAAIRPHKPFTELTVQDWEAVRGVVLDGAIYCTRAVIESMVKNKYGRIVFFTGEGAFMGGSGRAAVSAGFRTIAKGHASGWNSDARRRSRAKRSMYAASAASSWLDATSMPTKPGPLTTLASRTKPSAVAASTNI